MVTFTRSPGSLLINARPIGDVVEGNGEKMTFQLVMPEDANAEKGLISTTSPIGRALINKEHGDSVKVTTPGGMRQFEIVKLFTIHDEAAG